MKFQSQPNMWSCSVTSAAMVMDEPVQDLIMRIGHDGGEIVFPDLPEPVCRAGFAIQEIIDAALKMGWSVTPIEAMPQCTPDGKNIRAVFPEIKGRMDDYFKRYSGLVEGERLDGKYWHNVAWDHERQLWLDPSGPQLPKERPPVKVAAFWIFMKNERFLQEITSRKIKSLLDKPVKIENFDLSKPIRDMGPRRMA